jgi:hypothetical protein
MTFIGVVLQTNKVSLIDSNLNLLFLILLLDSYFNNEGFSELDPFWIKRLPFADIITILLGCREENAQVSFSFCTGGEECLLGRSAKGIPRDQPQTIADIPVAVPVILNLPLFIEQAAWSNHSIVRYGYIVDKTQIIRAGACWCS